MRVDYRNQPLSESEVNSNPFLEFSLWFHQAEESQIPEPNAMALATADSQGKPSCRIVLLKGMDEKGFQFFTNYQSRKGNEMAINPQVSLVFNWLELARQVRIEGKVEKLSRAENEKYFQQRPYESRLSAVVSPQSSLIQGKGEMETNWDALRNQTNSTQDVPCPEYWGGYRVIPDIFEFWQGRPGRFHDRIQYRKENDLWVIGRLAP